MIQNKPKLIMLAVASGLIIAVLLIFALVQSQKFRLTGSIPKVGGTIATSTGTIKLEFNKEIDNSIEYADKLEGDAGTIIGIDVEGKVLLLRLAPLIEDVRYNLVLRDIRSKSGESIDRLPVTFTTRYVPYDQLSSEQKEFEVSETDKNNQEDPLSAFLPYEGDRIYLSGEYSLSDEGESIFVVDAKLFLTRVDLSNRDSAVAKYKERVRTYISSKGFDPDAYLIRYDINEPPSN